MSAVLVGQAVPHSPEWHALRAGGIGGSEIAAVVGLSPWTSPFQLWHRKRGLIGEQRQSEAMEWGTRLEPVITQKFIDEHPEWAVRPTPGTYAHSERPWQRCNPDGTLHSIISGDIAKGDYSALLEVKTVNAYADDFTKDSVPVYYATQVQWQLDIFGLDVCYAAVLIGGNTYREYVIEANPTDQAYLREKAEVFWASVENDERPPIDASDHTYETVRELNPLINKDLVVDLNSELWADYLRAKATVTEGEEALTLAKSRILDVMGQARVARFAKTDVLRRQLSSSKTPYLKEVS